MRSTAISYCIRLAIIGLINAAAVPALGADEDAAQPAATTAPADQQVTRFYQIDPADINAVRTVLQQNPGPGRRSANWTWGEPGVLIVTGSPQQHEHVMEVIATAKEESARISKQTQMSLFQLRHVKASDAAEQIKALVPVKIGVDERTNTLIVTGSVDTLQRVQELAERLDVPSAEPMPVQVIELQYADPEHVVRTLMNVLDKNVEITPAAGANAVLVRARKSVLEEVQGLIGKIDVEPRQPGAQAPDIRIIQLHPDFKVDENLEQAVRMLLDNSGSVAVDRVRNSIILKAPKARIVEVEKMLESLQSTRPLPVNARSDQQWNVRVVWLVGKQDGSALSDGGEQNLQESLADLRPVLAELESMGIRNLKLVAQMMVATSRAQFEMSAAPILPIADEQVNCLLQLNGELSSSKDGSAGINLSLNVREQPEAGAPARPRAPSQPHSSNLAQLRTFVVAPVGHPVALGAAPIGDLNSVFILQLLAAK